MFAFPYFTTYSNKTLYPVWLDCSTTPLHRAVHQLQTAESARPPQAAPIGSLHTLLRPRLCAQASRFACDDKHRLTSWVVSSPPISDRILGAERETTYSLLEAKYQYVMDKKPYTFQQLFHLNRWSGPDCSSRWLNSLL